MASRRWRFPLYPPAHSCYPLSLAAPVAMRAIVDFLRDTPDHGLTVVRLVLYPQEQPQAYGIYANALQQILPPNPQ